MTSHRKLTLTVCFNLALLTFGAPTASAADTDNATPKASASTSPVQSFSSKHLQRSIYFLDSRGMTTLKPHYGFPLPGKFHFFGFTNLNSAQGWDDEVLNLHGFFTEARLTSPLFYNFGIQAELNAAAGPDNTLVRFGLLYRFVFEPYEGHKWVLIPRVHPIETDLDGGQASLLYAWKLYEDLLFLDGTLDFNWGEKSFWVFEPNLSTKIYGPLRFSVEGRLNSKEAKPWGVAGGLEFKAVL